MNISVSNKFRDRALYLLIKRALRARNQYENQSLAPTIEGYEMHRAPRRTSLRRGLIKIQYKGKKGIDA